MKKLFVLLLLVFVPTLSWAQDEPVVAEPPPTQMQVQLNSIESLEAELSALKDDAKESQGAERELVLQRAADRRSQLSRQIDEFVREVAAAQESATPPEAATVANAKKMLRRNRDRIRDDLADAENALTAAKDSAASAETPDKKSEFDAQVNQQNRRIISLLKDAQANLESRKLLGEKVEADQKKLDERIEARARRLAAQLENASKERAEIRERPATSDEEKSKQRRDVQLATQKLDGIAESMNGLIELMRARNLDTAAYRQLVIESTGRVTSDVFDAEVGLGLASRWVRRMEDWVVEHAPQALFGLLLFGLILVIARLVASIVRRFVRKWVKRTQLSQLASEFVVVMSGRAVMIVGLLTGLSQLGVEMGPVLAGLGIAGFVVGFALQDTLSNFASGMMILVYRPYDVGDLVGVAGITGKVEKMTLVSTSVLTLDNQLLVVPNSKIWGDVIRNVTSQTSRRVDMTFGIGYDDDIDHAKEVLLDIVSGIELVDQDQEKIVEVHTLNNSSVDFAVRVWTQTDNYWPVYWAITAEVKRRFDAEGITIPYPQRDVHMYQVEPKAVPPQGPQPPKDHTEDTTSEAA